jgi:hypothetical protein
MAKDKDRLPPGWRFDPDDDVPNVAVREVNNGNAVRIDVPYILLPRDDAVPLWPSLHAVVAYLTARQISAFLREL